MKYHVNLNADTNKFNVSGPSINNPNSVSFDKEQADQVAIWLNSAYQQGGIRSKQKIAKALGIPSGLIQ